MLRNILTGSGFQAPPNVFGGYSAFSSAPAAMGASSLQAPALDMFGQSNNSGALLNALRGLYGTAY